MRTYGRVAGSDGVPVWVEVQTDDAGFNSYVYLTTLAQCLKLALGESPFFAQYGIPAQRSIVQQVAPDFYVARTQQQFSPFFAALIVTKQDAPEPTYRLNVTTQQGTKIQATIAT